MADQGPKKPVRLFDNHQPFEILSFTHMINHETTDKDTSGCNDWSLTKAAISEIMKHSVPLDGTTWDLSFLVLACAKSVIVLQKGQRYDIALNAGSYFSVYNGDTTVLFADYKKTDRKYFIEGPDRR